MSSKNTVPSDDDDDVDEEGFETNESETKKPCLRILPCLSASATTTSPSDPRVTCW